MKRIKVEAYNQAIQRVETDLRAAKVKMAQSGYQSNFDWQKLYRLKAEATRLYALRTEFRAHPHPITGGWWIGENAFTKKTFVEVLPQAPHLKLTRLQVMKRVLEGEPGWEKPLIEDYIPPAPVEAQPTA